MESVSKIRRWVLVEGRSIRSVARATGLSRNTIKKYLRDDSPPSYQRHAPPVRHKLCNGFDLRLRPGAVLQNRQPDHCFLIRQLTGTRQAARFTCCAANPVGVASGDALIVGNIFGIAAYGATAGDPVEIATTGVFQLPKASAAVLTVGARVSWDDAAKQVEVQEWIIREIERAPASTHAAPMVTQ